MKFLLAYILLAVCLATCYSTELEEINELYRISKFLKANDSPNSLELYSKFANMSDSWPMDIYDEKRSKLIKQDRAFYFTVDVPKLNEDEQLVEKKMLEMRDELVQQDHTPLLLPFYEGKKIIQDSKLHRFFKGMPKGGHMHVHIEASVSMDTFMNFTRKDFVYYNMAENQLKTAPKGLNEPGFEK